MSLSECQINPIDVNFHLQKSLEIFDKNSATKNQKAPCLMPIRVRASFSSAQFHLGVEICFIINVEFRALPKQVKTISKQNTGIP